jgi:flagellar hook-length control protein FliK
MIGPMNSFASDAATMTKSAKSGGIGFGVDAPEGLSGFDALMAGLSGINIPGPAPSQPADGQQAVSPDVDATQASVQATGGGASSQGFAAPSVNQSDDMRLAAGENATSLASLETADSSVVATGEVNSISKAPTTLLNETQTPTLTPNANVADKNALVTSPETNIETTASAPTSATQVSAALTELSALLGEVAHTGEQANQTAPAVNAQSTRGVKTNPQTAATNAVPSTDQTQSDTPNLAIAPAQASSPVAIEKSKAAVTTIEHASQVAPKSVEPASGAFEFAGSGETAGLTDGGTPASTDTAPRAPQLTPNTVPMLAATMVRRLESGAKQFSMRLDPPELGQVEVKLTMEAGKKVRAVISAERPEALADLVRSARDLVRALNDAGLNVDENGLTFTLNDPASDQGGQGQNEQKTPRHHDRLNPTPKPNTEIEQSQDALTSAPFQRWQRARIALTA